jgi:glyoxylase-like metal-dependent hydrolase (beta-lactamase superfamily II)
MELAPGLHALELAYERAGEDVLVHPTCVETRRGLMLFDCGLPESLGQMETQLAAIDESLDQVVRVLVTHQDADHAGALNELVTRTGAQTLAHVDDAPYIDGRKRPLGTDDEHRYPPAPIDMGVVGGERLRTKAGPAHLVHTPGHTPGHLSIYFPRDKLLIAGDALVAEAGRLTGPRPAYTPDLGAAYESLAMLADLDIERVHCFHGGTVDADDGRIEAIADKGPSGQP